jgi:hypothetical protein
MPLIKTVETLARGAVGTAAHVARHPLGAAANVAGFAKGVVGSGVGLAHGDGASTSVPETSEQSAPEATSSQPSAPAVADEPAASPAPPEKKIPGPDIVLAGVPDPGDLPEPIVIYADDEPAPGTGEAFQTEPKAGSRTSRVGGSTQA